MKLLSNTKYHYDSCYWCHNCKYIPHCAASWRTETMRSGGAGNPAIKFKLKKPMLCCNKCHERVRTKSRTPKHTRARLNPRRIE